jgi:hypothetical protein
MKKKTRGTFRPSRGNSPRHTRIFPEPVHTLSPLLTDNTTPYVSATPSSSSTRQSRARSPRGSILPLQNPVDLGHKNLPRLILFNPPHPLSDSPLHSPNLRTLSPQGRHKFLRPRPHYCSRASKISAR